MMSGPGDWTPELVRAHMHSNLGDADYERMLEYMRAHSRGEDLSGFPQSGRMWQMMGAMMDGWSGDDWDRCWGWMLERD
jgi:hypothetical protein